MTSERCQQPQCIFHSLIWSFCVLKEVAGQNTSSLLVSFYFFPSSNIAVFLELLDFILAVGDFGKNFSPLTPHSQHDPYKQWRLRKPLILTDTDSLVAYEGVRVHRRFPYNLSTHNSSSKILKATKGSFKVLLKWERNRWNCISINTVLVGWKEKETAVNG